MHTAPFIISSASPSQQPDFASIHTRLELAESRLLEHDLNDPDPTQLDEVALAYAAVEQSEVATDIPEFRALAHLLKSSIANIRRGVTPLKSEMVDAFLAANDCLKLAAKAHLHGNDFTPDILSQTCACLGELMAPPKAVASPKNNPDTLAMNPAHPDRAEEFLTFSLGREEYAIDILKVQEIRGYVTPTTLANLPPFIKGVIDLRGTIVPIIDLRIKFGLCRAEYTEFTVIIVLNLDRRVVGIVVDGVSEVAMLKHREIHPPPEFGAGIDTRYVAGLSAIGDRMLIVVDIEKLMAAPDMALVDRGPTP
jgi:purine-binding chemotaxis protein CheW